MVSSPAYDTVIRLILISSTVRSFEVTPGILSLSFSDDVYMFLASIAKSVLTGSTSLVILSILFIVDYKNRFYVNCWGEIKISLQFITLFGFHSGGNFSLSAGG